MTWTHGIDTSRVQGTIHAGMVYDQGFRFGFVKISEGGQYLDPMRLQTLKALRAAGILDGGYHFARPNGSAKTQAQILWDGLGDTMPTLPLVLDLETASGMPGEWVCEWALEFAECLKGAWVLKPICYTGGYFMSQLGCAAKYPQLAEIYSQWLAQYSRRQWEPVEGIDRPKVVSPWPDWEFWQYSGDGGMPVVGVSVDCDRNVYNGSLEQLRARCGLPDHAALEQAILTARGTNIVDYALEAYRRARGEGNDTPPEAA